MKTEISKFRRELVELNKKGRIDIHEGINKYEVGLFEGLGVVGYGGYRWASWGYLGFEGG